MFSTAIRNFSFVTIVLLAMLITIGCRQSEPAEPGAGPAGGVAPERGAPGARGGTPGAQGQRAVGAPALPMHGPAGAGRQAGAGPSWNFLTRFDQNNDGQLERNELPQHFDSLFSKADADGSGAVTRQEIEAVRGRAPEGSFAMGRGPGGVHGQSPHRPGAFLPGPSEIMRHWDKNGDNQLTTDELPAGPGRSRLASADSNGDGIITLQELEASGQRMHNRGFGGGRGPGDRPGQGPGQGPGAGQGQGPGAGQGQGPGAGQGQGRGGGKGRP